MVRLTVGQFLGDLLAGSLALRVPVWMVLWYCTWGRGTWLGANKRLPLQVSAFSIVETEQLGNHQWPKGATMVVQGIMLVVIRLGGLVHL